MWPALNGADQLTRNYQQKWSVAQDPKQSTLMSGVHHPLALKFFCSVFSGQFTTSTANTFYSLKHQCAQSLQSTRVTSCNACKAAGAAASKGKEQKPLACTKWPKLPKQKEEAAPRGCLKAGSNAVAFQGRPVGQGFH